MLYLNFSNIEDIVFFDNELQKLMPEHFSIFEQWRLGKRISYLKDISKQAVLDFLSILDDDSIELLEQYFGEKIEIERLNYSIATNYKIPLADSKICETLCGINQFNYFSTWRDDEYVYISFWR